MKVLRKRDVQDWLLRCRPRGEVAADHMYGHRLSYWECGCGVTRPRGGECAVCGHVDAGPACDDMPNNIISASGKEVPE